MAVAVAGAIVTAVPLAARLVLTRIILTTAVLTISVLTIPVLPVAVLTRIATVLIALTITVPIVAVSPVTVSPVTVAVIALSFVAPPVLTPVFGGALLLVVADGIAFEAEIVVAVEFVLRAARGLFVIPPALIAHHAEIMIRELQIIFGVDAVALHLRVARHVAIFFVELRRIAARAAVDPVAAVALPATTVALRALLSATTATTATVLLPIIDQASVPRPSNQNGLAPERRCMFPGCIPLPCEMRLPVSPDYSDA